MSLSDVKRRANKKLLLALESAKSAEHNSGVSNETPINGKRLKAARKNAGLRQHQLAARVGTTQGQISAIEGGRRGTSVEVLTKIASVLGVGIGWLCGGTDPDHSSPGRLSAESILEDQESPPGLVAFAGDRTLVASLDVQADEWGALRGLVPPGSLTKQGYLMVLLAIRANLEEQS